MLACQWKAVSSAAVVSGARGKKTCGPLIVQVGGHCISPLWPGEGDVSCLLPECHQGVDRGRSWTRVLWRSLGLCGTASDCFAFTHNGRENHQREKKKGFKNKAK